MSTTSILQHAETLIRPRALRTSEPQPNRLDVELAPEDLLAAVSLLVEEEWGYLVAITGLDTGGDRGILDVLYHFAAASAVLTLRISVPLESPIVPTIAGVLPAARIFEQELSEILGIRIVEPVSRAPLYNRHLFLPDDWPLGVYPMRKEFQSLEALHEAKD